MGDRMAATRICSVADCGKTAKTRGLCPTHYSHLWKHGDPLAGPFHGTPKPPCSVAGCSRQSRERGLCGLHYHRLLRHGDPLGGKKLHGAPLAWITALVDYKGSDCITDWPFWKNPDGYAGIYFRGEQMAAARALCILANGPPPTPAHEVCHNCGNGHLSCLNPHHLRWGTRAENAADRVIHGTDHRGEKHPQAKLTAAQVVEIRAMRGTVSQVILAKIYGVSQSAISGIQRRTRWPSLP